MFIGPDGQMRLFDGIWFDDSRDKSADASESRKKEAVYRDKIASLIPYAHTEYHIQYGNKGYGWIDIKTLGNRVQLKDGIVETQLLHLLGQGIQCTCDKEGKKTMSVMIAFNCNGVNKKKKRSIPGTALALMPLLVQLISPAIKNLMFLTDSVESNGGDLKKIIKILRDNDRKFIKENPSYFNETNETVAKFLDLYNKQCNEIDMKEWGELLD